MIVWINGIERPLFKEHVPTDGLTVEEVVDKIAQVTSLKLKKVKRNLLRKRMD